MKMLSFVLAILFVNSAFGQEEQRSALQSDRPGLTDSPFTVAEGVLQLEMGWTYTEHGNGSDIDSHQFPQTLLRFGLQTNLELRVGWDGYSFVDVADGTDEIASDMFVGLKWHLSSQTDELPAQGLLFGVSLPTGHHGQDVDPSLKYAWSWDFDDVSSIGGNIGISAPTDDVTEDRFGQGLFSVSYSRSLNDDIGWFAEYYTNFPAADGEDAEHVVQTGLNYMVNEDLSFDCIVGAGLNNQADDFLVGLGFTLRF